MKGKTLAIIAAICGLIAWSMTKKKAAAAGGSTPGTTGGTTTTLEPPTWGTVTSTPPNSGSTGASGTPPITGTPVIVPPGTPVVPITYTAKVIDMATQQPIEGAMVTLNGMTQITDQNGTTVFNNVSPSNSTSISFSASGYQPVTIQRSFGITAPNPSSTVALPELAAATSTPTTSTSTAQTTSTSTPTTPTNYIPPPAINTGANVAPVIPTTYTSDMYGELPFL